MFLLPTLLILPIKIHIAIRKCRCILIETDAFVETDAFEEIQIMFAYNTIYSALLPRNFGISSPKSCEL